MQTGRLALFSIALALLFFNSATQTQAAKKRVWSTTGATKTTVNTATRPTYSVKIRSDRKALTVYFYSVASAKSIEYELTYMGNGIEQGAYGTVNGAEGNSVSRLLLFGTCSHKVCTYHSNIQNTVLKITAKANNGKTYIKKYRIKI